MSNEPSRQTSGLSTFIYKILPIHGFEMKKFLPLGIMMGLILCNYTFLRNAKDAFVNTDKILGGAEVLPYLKFFWVLPCAIIFTLLYNSLSNRFSKKQMFYLSLMPFLVFYVVFAVFLYPYIDYFHMSRETLHQICLDYNIQDGLTKIMLKSCGMWAYSLFYTMTELWGSAVVALLFFGFANQITATHEAKRFYPSFVLVANLFVALGSGIGRYASTLSKQESAMLLGMVTTLNIIIIIGIYMWMYKNVLTDKRFYDPEELKSATKKTKQKVSMSEGLKTIFASRHLAYIATLVLAYGITMNIVEGPWKKKITQLYPDGLDYQAFTNTVSMYTAFITIATSLLGSYALKRFGWLATALMTPGLLLVCGSLFYGLILFETSFAEFTELLLVSPLFLAVIFGACSVVISKTFKYGFFDPTKEMAYIPLDDTLKVKGKAVVDVVGGRLGKSGGALIQIILFAIMGVDLVAITPYLALVFVVLCICWIFSINELNKSYTALLKQKEEEALRIASTANV